MLLSLLLLLYYFIYLSINWLFNLFLSVLYCFTYIFFHLLNFSYMYYCKICLSIYLFYYLFIYLFIKQLKNVFNYRPVSVLCYAFQKFSEMIFYMIKNLGCKYFFKKPCYSPSFCIYVNSPSILGVIRISENVSAQKMFLNIIRIYSKSSVFKDLVYST